LSDFRFNPNDLHRLRGLTFRTRARRSSAAIGGRPDRRAGDGTDFLDYRPYTPGDDVRHVDWNLYGRLRQVFVRLHDRPRQLSVTILVDRSRSMGFGGGVGEGGTTKLAYAQRTACALAFVALRAGERVSVGGFADGLDPWGGPFAGPRGLAGVIGCLRRCSPSGSSSLAVASAAIRGRGRRGGLVFILSDFMHPTDPHLAVAPLTAVGCRVVVLHIVAPVDRGEGLSGSVVLTDSETGRRVQVDVTPQRLAEYRRTFDAWGERLASTLRLRRQGYFMLDTRDDYVEAVARVVRAEGVSR
jgi:uncharacterized protein (DUF58 family)